MIYKDKQAGQIIIILLLLVLVVLSVGLAVTQRSTTDVSTSTQTEQSSRAVSAAEAGLEKALSSTVAEGYVSPDLGNNSSFKITTNKLLPLISSNGVIEYPPIGKEITAQFWLANPALITNNISSVIPSYSGLTFDLYFGNPNPSTAPAVELTMVYLQKSTGKIMTWKKYYDSDNTRLATNHFTSSCTTLNPPAIHTILSDLNTPTTTSTFLCKVSGISVYDAQCPSNLLSCTPIMVRARLLYSTPKQSIALAPATGANFPPQAAVYVSQGIAGQSQKKIQVFQISDVVPPWLDFAIFSINDIKK